jgi:hypothetical protein
MCYQLRDGAGGVSDFSSGTYVNEKGEFEPLSHEDFSIETTGFWKSPQTQATYPSGWKVKLPKYDLDLTVEPVMPDQEIDSRGTTMIVTGKRLRGRRKSRRGIRCRRSRIRRNWSATIARTISRIWRIS